MHQRVFLAVGDPDFAGTGRVDGGASGRPSRRDRKSPAAVRRRFCRARARTRIQPEAKAVTGSGKRRVQRSMMAEGGASVMVPARSAFLTSFTRPQLAELDAAALDSSA